MATLEDRKTELQNDDRFISVADPVELPGQLTDIPGMSLWEIKAIEANGETYKTANIRVAVYKKGEHEQIADPNNPGQTINGDLLEQAFFTEDRKGDLIKGNLQTVYQQVIQALISKTGCKAWRSIEKNTERDYATFKCLIEATPEDSQAGTGEWKIFSVYEDENGSYKVLETPQIGPIKPDVIK